MMAKGGGGDLFAQAFADLAPTKSEWGNYEKRNKEARKTTAIHPLPKGRKTGELIRVEHWPNCPIPLANKPSFNNFPLRRRPRANLKTK
jgi:hypothetical protein